MSYVTIYEEYKHKFFQLPKVFYTSDRYRKMSNNSKVAWSVLRDRSSLSRKNNWFDKETGRIYFIFTNEDLMELLNIGSKATLSSIKKELEEAKLIESQRLGFNRPNKMYLLNPIVSEEDIIRIDELEGYVYEENKKKVDSKTLDNQGRTHTVLPEQLQNNGNSETLGGQGRTLSGRPKSELQDVQKVYSNNTEYSNTDLKELDTIDTEDTKINRFQSPAFQTENSKENLKNQYMEKAFFENHEVIPEQLAHILHVFSENPKEAKGFYNLILMAKNAVAVENNYLIWFENEPELVYEVVNAFSRAVRKIEKERNVSNRNGYIYKSIYQTLNRIIGERVWENSESPDQNSLHSYRWIENDEDDS